MVVELCEVGHGAKTVECGGAENTSDKSKSLLTYACRRQANTGFKSETLNQRLRGKDPVPASKLQASKMKAPRNHQSG